MRKLIGGFVFLVIAVAVFMLVAASQLNTYLNDNKEWIAAQIEAVLGRPVQFDEVGVSVSRGLAIEIDGFRIAEDERFDQGDFLSVGKTEVRVALWPALFGRIEVTKISLREVMLSVIQTDAGLSTDSLGASSETETETETEAEDTALGEASSSTGEAFYVALAEIRSGRLRFVDRTTEPPSEVVIDQLEFWTTDVGLTRPLEFQFLGELLGDGDANLSVAGSFGPIPSSPGEPTPLAIEFSLDPIQLSKLRSLPGMGDAIDPNRPPEGSMRISGRVVGSVENPQLEFKFDATDALVPYGEDGQKDRGAPLRLDLDVAMAGRDLEIRAMDLAFEGVELHASGKVTNLDDPTIDLVIDIFDGTVELGGGWTLDGRLDLDTVVTDIDLGEMTRSLASESAEVLDGRLSMSLAVSGMGKTWEEIKPGLEGLGRAQIDGGVLHDINLVEEALGGFIGIPGLSAKLPQKMREKYPTLFSTGDTEFERMQGKVEVRDGRVYILGIDLSAAEFALRGHGSVSLDGDLDMSTRIVLSRRLTKDLIDEAKPLKYLRDKDDRIEVPVRITGRLPDVSARPDTDAIAKKLGSGATKRLAKKSLGKLIKKRKKKRSTAPASADDGRALLESLLK